MSTTSTSQILRKNKINDRSISHIMQGVRDLCDKRGRRGATAFVQELTGISTTLPRHPIKLVQFVQYVTKAAANNEHDNYDDLLQGANDYVAKSFNDPNKSWMYVISADREQTMAQREIEGAGAVSVPVDHEGNMKRGSKTIIAEELYTAHVVNGSEQTSRKAMIELFVAEAGLTPAGASTYFAKMKSTYGDPKGLLVSGRKKKATPTA